MFKVTVVCKIPHGYKLFLKGLMCLPTMLTDVQCIPAQILHDTQIGFGSHFEFCVAGHSAKIQVNSNHIDKEFQDTFYRMRVMINMLSDSKCIEVL